MFDGEALNVFFQTTFGAAAHGGHICIALRPAGGKSLREKYFPWPDGVPDATKYVQAHMRGNNVYFCPHLIGDLDYRRERDGAGPRVRDNPSLICANVWADLDECSPDSALVLCSTVTETSPGSYQALWLLDSAVPPEEAMLASQRIAYHHGPEGADRTGWDLTQLLRVPFTTNYNYDHQPQVQLLRHNRTRYRLGELQVYPESHRHSGGGIPMPEPEDIPVIDDPIEFLQDRRRRINPEALRIFANSPMVGEYAEGWSGALWKLMMLLLEAGLSREEVFVIAYKSACNKYARDGRPTDHLWNDVCRAYIRHMEETRALIIPELEKVDLISKEELAQVAETETFIERYTEWATGLGDAAPQYHQAGAFVILSSILSGRVTLPTSFGTIVPNLWFMILADTTVTRKTTAMDNAVDLLVDIDPDVIMATDGSIEGLLQGLSTRPGRPSIFLRDEFSGLLESMTKKDYMAGMAEMLTKLYDGKFQKRLLRKDPIEIREPVLILFAGGIRTRIQELLTLEHISSGFMPRFIYITATSDVTRVRPLGPPVVRDLEGRESLLAEIQRLHTHYTQTIEVTVQGTGIHIAPPRKWKAELTPQAWARYNKFEEALLDAGVKSDSPDLMTPVYARLGVSTLKAAVLLAAAEELGDRVVVEELHILRAISYARSWREHAMDVINGVGTTSSERQLQRVFRTIQTHPGISRGIVMQRHHLTAHTAAQAFDTLVQRGLITATKFGKGYTYYPVETSS